MIKERKTLRPSSFRWRTTRSLWLKLSVRSKVVDLSAMVLYAARFVVVSIDLWPQDLRDKFYCEHSRIRTASRVIRLDNADLAAMVDRR